MNISFLLWNIKMHAITSKQSLITRGIFVMECCSRSSFSEGRKPERCSGTFISWHRYN
jgi:hypothetical protein